MTLLRAIALALLLAACGGDDDDTAAPDDETPATTVPTVLGVGDTDTTSDFEVTLHAVEDPFTPSTDVIRAEAGHRLVAVEITARNVTDEPQTFSVLAYTEVVDSERRPWDVFLGGMADRPNPDGDVPAGDARRGWIVYEVADDATDLELRVTGSVTASGIVFTLT